MHALDRFHPALSSSKTQNADFIALSQRDVSEKQHCIQAMIKLRQISIHRAHALPAIRHQQDRLIALESLDLAEPKTKLLSAELDQYGGGRKLIVTAETNENLYLAARNIPNVSTVDVGALDPVSLVGAEKVLVTVDALKQIEEWLG